MRRFVVAAAVLSTAVSGLVVGAGPAQARHRGVAAYDFNGDGRQDLAVGDPAARVGGRARAGAVFVDASTRSGAGARAVTFTEDSRGLSSAAAAGDRFGAVLASADFNGDGRADLAVGIPGKRVGSRHGAGAVAVFNGTANGLTSTLARLLQGPGRAGHHGGGFGHALAAADFNRDGYADLAVGGQGQVTLVFGSRRGLGLARTVEFAAGTAGGLAAGDINGDGKPDLATSTGVCFGAAHAPTDCRGPALGDGPKVVADVNNDGYADVVVGDPSAGGGCGAIRLYLGSRGGAVPQANPGVVPANCHDRRGAAVAAADMNADRRADVAAGAPGARSGRGDVVIERGARAGLSAKPVVVTAPAGTRRGDRFGASVAFVDLNGDHRPDLVIGAPGAGHGRGAVFVIPGRRHGLRLNHVQRLTPASLGVGHRHFGAVLGS